jgi:hypothetical protein
MRLLVVFLLAASSVLLSLTLLSVPIGLGERESFLLYRLLGTSRSDIAFWMAGIVAASLAALIADHMNLASGIATSVNNRVEALKKWFSGVRPSTKLTVCLRGLAGRPKRLTSIAGRLLVRARQNVNDWFRAWITRIRMWRPAAVDVAAIVIIGAYGILCWSTIFQSYRNYEELWAFETDGPFYVILLDRLAHGEVEPSAYYGYFPILAAYAFSLPVRLVNYVFGSDESITSLIVGFRVSQIFFVLLAGWLVYLIATSLSTRLLGIVCLISFFSVSEVFRWTAFIHPDIQQISMTLAGCYFLIKYMESRHKTYFFISAVFAGFATASKYFGVFLIPAAAVAALAVCLPQSRPMTAIRQSVRWAVLYGAVHTVAYLIATPPLIRHPLRSLRYMIDFSSGDRRVLLENAFSADLWQRKAKLFFDNAFLGRAICVAFVVAVIWTLAASIARRRIDRVHVLTAIVISYCVGFLALWGDLFNIEGGYRYLLQPAALVPIVIVVALDDAGKHFGLPGRGAAAVAGFWILVLIIPYSLPARIQHISELVSFYWTREQTGQFLIRRWIEENLPPGSRILTQAYLNIQIPGHVPEHRYDQGSRWRGRQDIRVFYDPSNHVYITPKAVAAIDPDFILGINEREISEVLTQFPRYQLIAKVGERRVVFVLGKKAS